MLISINNILETVCNPAGRFRTLTGIVPRYGENQEHNFLYSQGVACFAVMWEGKDYILKTIFNNARFPEKGLRQVSAWLHNRPNPYFGDYRYLGNEMLVYDDAGNGHYCDIVLAEEAGGASLGKFILEKCDAGDTAALEKVLGNYCGMAADLLRMEIVHNRIKPSNILVAHDLSCRLAGYESALCPGMDSYDSSRDNDNAALAMIAVMIRVAASNPHLCRTLMHITEDLASLNGSGLLPVLIGTAGSRPVAELSRMIADPMYIKDKDKLISLIRELPSDRTVIVLNSDGYITDARRGSGNSSGGRARGDAVPAPGVDYSRYDHIFPMEEFLYSVAKDDKWGYIDDRGEWVIEPIYDWADSFSEGRAVVNRGGCYGLIDKSGAEVMPAVYEDVIWDCGHVIVAAVQDGKVGLYDRHGRNIAPFRYDYAGEMSCGLMAVGNNGKYGYMDCDGNIAIDFLFDYASDFVEGRAYVIASGERKIILATGETVEENIESDLK